MKVKTYKTRSLHEGLEDIKRDLGSEALILSTRSVSVRPPFSLFKKPAWEITAALEEKVASKAEPSPGATHRPLPLGEAAAEPRVRVTGPTKPGTATQASPSLEAACWPSSWAKVLITTLPTI